ncbi:MAG TPA: flagellar filament capping protein FliD [Thermoleophilaceae bacterium]
MTGISLGGLASGLDSDALITQLMQIQQQPKIRMQRQEKFYEQRQTTLNDVGTRLKNLQSAAKDLSSVLTWASSQTVESSSASQVAASLLNGSAPGGHQIAVSKLASADQWSFDFSSPTADTSITLTPEDPTKSPVSVQIAAGATIQSVADSINGASSSPAYAVVVGNKLVISSRTSGADFGLTSVDSADGTTLTGGVLKAGADAEFSVDGGATQTSASNVVTSAIPGVQLALKSLTAPGESVTISVSEPATDKGKVKDALKKFVEQYNSTVDFIRTKTTEKRIASPETDADALKGVLYADTGLSGLLSGLRTAMSSIGPGALDQLSELGITTGSSTGGASNPDALAGKLVIDDTKLDAAITNNLSGLKSFLGAGGSDGFSQKISGILDGYTRSDGLIASRKAEAESQANVQKTQIARLDTRLGLQEERLRKQFATLESVLSASQSQQSWLTGQLNALG